MKYAVLLIILLHLQDLLFAQLPLFKATIKFNFSEFSPPVKSVFIRHTDVTGRGLSVVDSVPVKKGRAEYFFSSDEPRHLMIHLNTSSAPAAWLFADSSAEVFGLPNGTLKIQGSVSQSIYEHLSQNLYAVTDSVKKLKASMNAAMGAGQKDSLQQLISNPKFNYAEIFRTAFDSYKATNLAPYLLAQTYSWKKDDAPGMLSEMFRKLTPQQQAYPSMKILLRGIKTAIETAVGRKIKSFSLPDAKGQTVDVSKINGRIILIDFWASWCVPCRKENPLLVELNNRYKDKGLKIISISLDHKENKKEWMDAIAADRLTWINLNDNMLIADSNTGLQNALAAKLGVTLIPSNFILNNGHIIIAKNKRGKELETLLAELFSE